MRSMDRAVVGSFLMLSMFHHVDVAHKAAVNICVKSLLPLQLSLIERVGALTTSSVCVVGQRVILQDGEVVRFPVD